MTMTRTHPPSNKMRRLIEFHGATGAARVMLAALIVARRPARPTRPDRLRADVGLPSVEREMRRHWELR